MVCAIRNTETCEKLSKLRDAKSVVSLTCAKQIQRCLLKAWADLENSDSSICCHRDRFLGAFPLALHDLAEINKTIQIRLSWRCCFNYGVNRSSYLHNNFGGRGTKAASGDSYSICTSRLAHPCVVILFSDGSDIGNQLTIVILHLNNNK